MVLMVSIFVSRGDAQATRLARSLFGGCLYDQNQKNKEFRWKNNRNLKKDVGLCEEGETSGRQKSLSCPKKAAQDNPAIDKFKRVVCTQIYTFPAR
jgi:hypothetical protein